MQLSNFLCVHVADVLNICYDSILLIDGLYVVILGAQFFQVRAHHMSVQEYINPFHPPGPFLAPKLIILIHLLMVFKHF